MTTKEAQKKLFIAEQVCHFASGFFGVVAEQQKQSKKHILNEDFVSGLWDMSLKEIAHLLDTIKDGGGSIPKECRDILK